MFIHQSIHPACNCAQVPNPSWEPEKPSKNFPCVAAPWRTHLLPESTSLRILRSASSSIEGPPLRFLPVYSSRPRDVYDPRFCVATLRLLSPPHHSISHLPSSSIPSLFSLFRPCFSVSHRQLRSRTSFFNPAGHAALPPQPHEVFCENSVPTQSHGYRCPGKPSGLHRHTTRPRTNVRQQLYPIPARKSHPRPSVRPVEPSQLNHTAIDPNPAHCSL